MNNFLPTAQILCGSAQQIMTFWGDLDLLISDESRLYHSKDKGMSSQSSPKKTPHRQTPYVCAIDKRKDWEVNYLEQIHHWTSVKIGNGFT